MARLTVLDQSLGLRHIISMTDHLPRPANVSSYAAQRAQWVDIHPSSPRPELDLQGRKTVDYIVAKVVTGTLTLPVCSDSCNNCFARSM